jgi:histidine triad (HIT) family protein
LAFRCKSNAKGHTLCIPKFEIDKIFDMDEAHYLGYAFLKKDCYSFRAGGSLQAHRYVSDWSRSAHTYSLNEMDEMRFQNKVSLTKEKFQALRKASPINYSFFQSNKLVWFSFKTR